MYPYPCFEDFGLIVTCMQNITLILSCAPKNKSYVDVKNIKSIAHTKTFSNYIWLCVVNGRFIRVISCYAKLCQMVTNCISNILVRESV